MLSSRVVGGVDAAERLTEEIIENMAEGLIAADTQGRILAVNEKARALLGFAQGRRLEGCSVDEFVGREERELVAERLRAGAQGHWEIAFSAGTGRKIPILMTTTALRDNKGRKRGTVLLLQDLSLRREVEAAARKIAKLEELTDVARGIAHEVRNPLASMCGCAEEIAHEPHLSPETKRLTEILRREAHRVDGIIDEFLSFARIRKLAVSAVDAGELVAHVGDLLRARAGRSEVRVERPCSRLEVWGDRDLLTQLLLNLGINALEAIGEPAGMVRLRAAAVEDPGATPSGVEIVVDDNGGGIAREDLGKIFTPFFSRKARGSGLGLSIAQRIVLVHGGEIRVDSTPGRGTTFRVRLPLGSSAQEAAEREPEESVWT
jgi:PAS domain S-box-containing protein